MAPAPAAGVAPQLLANVNAEIASLRSSVQSAIAQLEGKWLGGAPAANAAAALRNLVPARVDPWAKRGADAAKSGTSPGPKGWAGWQEDGRVLLAGAADLAGFGLTANLDLIKESAAAVPADAARVVKQVAKTSADVLQATADATSGALGSLIRPLLLPLGLAAIGLVALAYLVKGRA